MHGDLFFGLIHSKHFISVFENSIFISDVIVFVYSPNFLILDEPTNHLDIATVEALGKAINAFKVNSYWLWTLG